MIAAWPLALLGAATGAALGSYATTAALRWARGEPSAAGRSHCDSCGVTLGFRQTLPVWSYVQAQGACAACGGRIDPIHVVGEMAGAITGAAAAATLPPALALLVGGLAILLLAAAVADIRTLRLPDLLTLAAGGVGAALAWLHGGWPGLMVGLGAAAVTFCVLALLRSVSSRLRGRTALGLGDVKLATALALWLGLATPWAIAGAAVLGLGGMALLRPADGRLAFGPYIAGAAWLVGLGGEWGWWPTTL